MKPGYSKLIILGLYVDKHLAFGAVHSTAIFERIGNFVQFILPQHGFQVRNYINDIYACCHFDMAQQAFDNLLEVIQNIGLPINKNNVFSPTCRLSIMGIVVYVNKASFSKLDKILKLCQVSLLRQCFAICELQSLLGKILYISHCMKGAHIFLNRMLALLCQHHDASHIYPDDVFYQNLLWFLNFVKDFLMELSR